MGRTTLKRDINLFTLIMYGVGVIVGAGIYVLVGKAAGITGNSIWMAFLLSSFVGIFTAMSYAELSSMFPKDASEYHYIQNAFKKDWLSVIMTLGESSGDLIGAAAANTGKVFTDNEGRYASAGWSVCVFIFTISKAILLSEKRSRAVYFISATCCSDV